MIQPVLLNDRPDKAVAACLHTIDIDRHADAPARGRAFPIRQTEAFIALGPSNVAVMIAIAIGLLAAGHWFGYEPGHHQAALMEVRR